MPIAASAIQRPPEVAAPSSQSPEANLIAKAKRLYGVRIVLDGQEWGDNLDARLANIQATTDAVANLPANVREAIGNAHPHGPLYILSNSEGRTLSGWRPYGDFPIGFYTNSDHDPEWGTVQVSNQVVLAPGFADIVIVHELLHAYHFRLVPPDHYGLALLGQEMQSFMGASGWKQVASDDAVAEASQPGTAWAEFNALFQYQGRELTYLAVDGNRYTFRPTNPLEGFAVAGSFFYSRSFSLALPDWPEYWAWFQANLG